MNDSRLSELERELRRRKRADARERRRRRRRAARVATIVLGAFLCVALAAGVVLLVLDRVSGTHASALAETSGTTAGNGSHRGRSQAGEAQAGGPRASGPGGGARSGAQGATAAAAPTRSPAGLQLGRPPLALDLSGSGEAVQASFRHPPRAGLLFDLSSGRVLWQLNPLTRMHIASLTKMMTALRVVRSSSPREGVLVTKQAVDSAGSKVGVLPLGKRVSLRTMLYGLMLPSGNDAAVALAQHVAGSVGAFVHGMNEEAARLGLACTRYSSPSGYYNIHDYSCAADLAELAHVDLEQPLIARVARTASAALPLPIKGGKVYLYNNNPLLVYGYPGATGLKTGYTELAGDCLVGTAERGGIRLGVVLLHSPELGRQAEHLLDLGFAAYGQPPIPAPPVPLGR